MISQSLPRHPPSCCAGAGLCRKCYMDKAIRCQYPTLRRLGRYNAIVIPTAAALCPTDAKPGSPEKTDILTARYASGQSLLHPLDADFPDTLPD